MLFMDMCIIASLGYIVLKFPLQRDTDKLKVSTVPLHICMFLCVPPNLASNLENRSQLSPWGWA